VTRCSEDFKDVDVVNYLKKSIYKRSLLRRKGTDREAISRESLGQQEGTGVSTSIGTVPPSNPLSPFLTSFFSFPPPRILYILHMYGTCMETKHKSSSLFEISKDKL
jgi:hypothetical protein